MTYNAEDFSRTVLAEFPELAEEFEEHSELLHVKMGAFAMITEGARRDGDWEKYERCVRLAVELLGRTTPDVENALNVSFLEHINFDGPSGPQAWERLSPRLQQAWRAMQVYLEELAASRKPGNSR